MDFSRNPGIGEFFPALKWYGIPGKKPKSELLGFSRSRTMTEFKKNGKPSSNNQRNSGTSKQTDRDWLLFKHIVEWKQQTTAAKVTAELNQHLNSPFSTKDILCELNKAAIRNFLLFAINIQNRLKWCRDHKGWLADLWKKKIPWWVQFFDFSYCLCVEAAHWSLHPWLPSFCSEARRWISDGSTSHIVEFSLFHRCPAW